MAYSKTMLDKLADAAPYNIFYNEIAQVTKPESNSVAFTDFLCPSLGQLKCSLHIAAKVDIQWLIKQYEIQKVETKPLTILYSNIEGKLIEKSRYPNVTLQCLLDDEEAKKHRLYSNHHEKISIYVYDDDSLRVVIATCNLRDQWERFNHGFWVSPRCRRLNDDEQSGGESPTKFKSDLLAFLNHYDLPILEPWSNYVTSADFSDVTAFLITSIPGRYSPENPGSHIQQVQNVLKKHSRLPPNEEPFWPVIAQASNLGQFGESPDVWLRSFFLNRLASPLAPLKIVFPTWKEVMNGVFDAELVGEGLRYSRAVHTNQLWLQDFLYQWKANELGRSKIMPHTKTYCRVSSCSTKVAWFLLTTGNVNKGAWGQYYAPRGGERTEDIFVRNCEIGVLLVPKFFGEKYFQAKSDVGEKVFPLLYDLPLRKYTEKDYPWSLRPSKHRAQK